MHGSFLNVLNDVVSLGFEKKKKKAPNAVVLF